LNIGSRLSWVRPFLVLVLVITVPVVVYWFGYVHASIRGAMLQFHTTVSAVATSLEGRLRTLDEIAGAAVGRPPGKGPDYLRSLVIASQAIPPRATHRLSLVEDERGLLLSVRNDTQAVESVSVKLEGLIPWDIVEAEFDGLVVLSASGRLLAQDRRLPAQARGLPVPVMRGGTRADLSEFFAEPGGGPPPASRADNSRVDAHAGETGVTSPAPRDPAWRLPTDFSRMESVTIAGTRYLAFLQPVRVYTSPLATSGDDADTATPAAVDVLVVGLVAEERMRRQSRALSPQTLSNVLAIVGLGIFLIPFLKLRFIGSRERMRYRDVFTMAAALLGLTAVVVLMLLDGPATATVRSGLDAGLRKLHEDVAARVRAEAREAVDQLAAATELPAYCDALALAPSRQGGDGAAPCTAATSKTPVGSSKGSLLLGTQRISYPVLDSIFLADAGGNQIYKWNTRTLATANVPVGRRAYFRDALALVADDLEGAGEQATAAVVAREYVVSATSGQEQMVFALPVDGRTGTMSATVPAEHRTHVAALTTPMRSLARTVVPAPYEFVLVARDRTVTFRNAKGPYLGQRFFEQVRGGSVLEALPRDGREITGSFAYRWRNVSAIASDIPELQMTLVTYYDTETARILTSRAFGAAAAFALAAVVSTILGSLIAAFAWGRKSHDWLWPDSEDTGRYVVGIAVCVAAVLLLVAIRQVIAPAWLAVGVLVIPGLVTALCGSPLWFQTRLRWQIGDPDTTPTLHKFAFCGFLLAMLMALVAAPTTLAFDDALRLYATGYQRVSALQWWRDLERTAWRFDAEFAEVQLDESDAAAGNRTCPVPGRTCASTTHFRELERTLVDRSDVPMQAGVASIPGDDWDLYRGCPDPFPGRVRASDAGAVGDGRAESAAHAVDCASALESMGTRLPWSFTTVLARPLARLGEAGPSYARALAADRDTAWDRPAWPLTGWRWTAWLPLWLFVGLGLLVFIVHSVAVHILGLGWRNQRLLDASARVEPGDGGRWLVLRPSRACLERLKLRATASIDLRHATPSTTLLTPQAGQTLLVEHVEAALKDETMRGWLLSLVSRPTPGCLILCSEIDPLYYFSQRVREVADSRVHATDEVKAATKALRVELEAQRAAWAAALSDFQKARVHPPQFPQLDESLPRPIRALLFGECRHSEPLIEIAQRLASSPDLARHREDEIIGFVLDAAEPYYRSIWELCSDDERLLLVQLAEEGVINPKRFDVFRQLHHRGLVVVEPRFGLMNRSFRDFVRSIESPERVLEWEQTPAALGWRRFSTPLYTLAAVVVAILLYTQQDLFSQMLAIATGAAGALNSLRSLGIMANAQSRPAATKTANA
jgi:hypothetical protein